MERRATQVGHPPEEGEDQGQEEAEPRGQQLVDGSARREELDRLQEVLVPRAEPCQFPEIAIDTKSKTRPSCRP